MKQSSLGLGTSTKRTRRREFLDEMDRVVPWSDLVAQIAPFMPEGKRGRPPFPVESLLRIHFMQQWFTLSDPAMEEALHDMPLFRDFAGRANPGDGQPAAGRQGSDAAQWHGGRCHADLGAKLDQER